MRFALLRLGAGAVRDVSRLSVEQPLVHQEFQHRCPGAARAAGFDLLHHLYYCFSTSQIQLGAGTQVSEPRAVATGSSGTHALGLREIY